MPEYKKGFSYQLRFKAGKAKLLINDSTSNRSKTEFEVVVILRNCSCLYYMV